jgi:uncharacterized protein YdaT
MAFVMEEYPALRNNEIAQERNKAITVAGLGD